MGLDYILGELIFSLELMVGKWRKEEGFQTGKL